MNRTGKIARLPLEIRQKLNERLHDGEMAKSLVAWLNSLPEVQAVLAAEFEGAPIREQNISEWRKGGYQDWVQHEAALEAAVRLAERAECWREEGQPSMSEMLAFWLMSQFLVATRDIAQAEGDKKWQLLNKMCANLMKLRRIEQEARQGKLAQEGPARDNSPNQQPPRFPAAASKPPTKPAASGGESGEHRTHTTYETYRTYESPANPAPATDAAPREASLAECNQPSGDQTTGAADPLPDNATAAKAMLKAREELQKWSNDRLALDGFNGGSGRKSVLTGRIKVERPAMRAAA